MTDTEIAQITDNPYKADFPILAANPKVAYLDSAATSQRPRAVIEAQSRFYETMNANALRGLYRWSVEATATLLRRSIWLLQALVAMRSNQATMWSFPSWNTTQTSFLGSKFARLPALTWCIYA